MCATTLPNQLDLLHLPLPLHIDVLGVFSKLCSVHTTTVKDMVSKDAVTIIIENWFCLTFSIILAQLQHLSLRIERFLKLKRKPWNKTGVSMMIFSQHSHKYFTCGCHCCYSALDPDKYIAL